MQSSITHMKSKSSPWWSCNYKLEEWYTNNLWKWRTESEWNWEDLKKRKELLKTKSRARWLWRAISRLDHIGYAVRNWSWSVSIEAFALTNKWFLRHGLKPNSKFAKWRQFWKGKWTSESLFRKIWVGLIRWRWWYVRDQSFSEKR